MKYRIIHSTHYTYSKPVSSCYNIAHLSPRNHRGQTCLSSVLEVEPGAAILREQEDYFGNRQAFFNVQRSHESLTVKATSEVEINPVGSLLDTAYSTAWDEIHAYLMLSTNIEDLNSRYFLLESPYIKVDPAIHDYASKSFPAGRPVVEAVHDLMQRIYHDFTYDPNFTTIATPLTEVLEHRKGVCQDFAHLAIACLISHNIPARYVSGYLETLPPPGKEKLQGADASHAWFSVYVPELGWVDFDPTNNQVPIDRHITTAWGRDYGDVTPLKGVIFGGGEKHLLDVSVDVLALDR